MILSIALPVIDVNFGQARNEQFQFLLIEDGDQLGGDDIMETCCILARVIW